MAQPNNNRERSEQEAIRWKKLNELKEQGFNYPNDVKITSQSKDVLEKDFSAENPSSGERYTLAGRIVLLRDMGKAGFFHILDGTGKIQCYIRKDEIGESVYAQFKESDIGDIVEVKGYGFVTKTGEKTVQLESFRLLVKGLIPLPEKWSGLEDVETRYRQRYVDLIANPEVRDVFRKRSKIISVVRNFLEARDFLEVECPVLQHIAAGGDAKPFATHYNALSADVFLRIALELPLKKLVVGGLERVYEIGRVFRNEGISKKHNPEFTMLEFYQAYATFEDLMSLTEDLFSELSEKICGTFTIEWMGNCIDLKPPYKKITMKESLHEIGGISRTENLDSVNTLLSIAEKEKIALKDPNDWGKTLEALFGELVEPKLINPTFITHHPFSISPLSRRNDENSDVTDRFELFIGGMEMANAFSELNDAEDQRRRFEMQAERKAKGDEEASDVEEDFLRALEYGLPPTAGQGIGIDRLVMLLTGSSTIRDVLFFPQLKPEE
jgi:lysyl-tRNA synthetase, class II